MKLLFQPMSLFVMRQMLHHLSNKMIDSSGVIG